MTVFSAIFDVDSSICKLRNLLGHFDEKDMVTIINPFHNVVCANGNCVIFLQTVQHFSDRVDHFFQILLKYARTIFFIKGTPRVKDCLKVPGFEPLPSDS